MKKKCTALITLLLVNSVLGIDGIQYLKNQRWFDVVSVTPTNLIVKPKGKSFSIRQNDVWFDVEKYTESGETLILPHDSDTEFLTQRAHRELFTPVIFKGQHKGFIIVGRNEEELYPEATPDNIGYVVLGNTKLDVGENDVEMILQNGEWKDATGWREKEQQAWRMQFGGDLQSAPKKENEVKETSPSLEPIQPAETPDDVAEDEKNRSSNFWFCALIPLCFLAIFYFLRRKTLTTNH